MNYLTYVSRSHLDGKVATHLGWGLLRRQHSGERGSAGLQDEFTMQELDITLPSDGSSENFRDSGARREHTRMKFRELFTTALVNSWKKKALIESLYFRLAPV